MHANKAKLWIASLLLSTLGQSATLHAAGVAADLTVSQVHALPTAPGSTVGVVYLVIANRGTAGHRLIGVRTPVAATAELHQTLVVDGLRQMRPVESLECPPGAVVKIEAGGLHLMLSGLRSPLTPGMHFALLLRFENSGDLTVDVPVQ